MPVHGYYLYVLNLLHMDFHMGNWTWLGTYKGMCRTLAPHYAKPCSVILVPMDLILYCQEMKVVWEFRKPVDQSSYS